MGSAGRAQYVMGGIHVGHPVPEGLVDGVLENPRAVGHRHHRGPQLLHPEDIGPLALDIHFAHVNGAIEAESGRHGGRGHPVLAGPGFGDHPGLAHAFDQQPLPHDVVGLVGAGVVEVLALDENPGPAEMVRQVLGKGDRRRPAGVAGHELFVFLPERGVTSGIIVNRFQFIEGGNQDLGQKRPAEIRRNIPV
jgi:hypothetical protein